MSSLEIRARLPDRITDEFAAKHDVEVVARHQTPPLQRYDAYEGNTFTWINRTREAASFERAERSGDLGSRSSGRGKEAEDRLGRGLADMKPPVGRQFGDASRNGAAVPKRPAFSRLPDRLATLFDQGTAIFVAATGDRVPIMSKSD
jgi:hypothetical protein